MLRFETEGARAVLDALDSGDRADVERAVDVLGVQLDFYATHVDDVTRETFRELLSNPRDAPEGFAVDALADGFSDARDRIETLRKRIAALESIDTDAIERDVCTYLPGNPELDATVYAVIDGFNAGYQHEGDVAISVLQTRPELFGPKLRHELHHVGAREVRGADPFERLSTPVSPARDTADLITVLMLEGLAIAYAQGGLSVYEDDPDVAATLDDYREREESMATEFDETVSAVAATSDPATRQELVESVVTDPEGALPPTHYLGARIIEKIGGVFGESRAVDLVTEIGAVLPTYQTAAGKTDAWTFSPDTVDHVSAAIASVEP